MSKSSIRNRNAAYERQNGFCFYCKWPMWAASARDRLHTYLPQLECTAEHLIPASDGGGGGAENIVAACRFCNQTRHKAKHVLDWARYQEHVRKRISRGKWHHPHAYEVLLSAGARLER